MADTPPEHPDDDLPDWWKRLSADEQEALRRVMGKDWQPSRKEEVERRFDLTRERIRQIEERALKKLRGRDDDK